MENKEKHDEYKKITFFLEQDKSGFPPFASESLWTIKKDSNLYKIDNLPFYIYNISLEDEVTVHKEGDELIFKSLVRKSSNSTIRLFSKDENLRDKLKKELESLGCKWEYSNIKSLSAINVPKAVNIHIVRDAIEKTHNYDHTIEYEISSLRQ